MSKPEQPGFHVINFFGGPCAGKSTAALGLAHELKKRWVMAELVTEYAKDLVWDDSAHLLSRQNLIFATQENRVNRLMNKVPIAITDSPLLLSAFYAPVEYPRSFKQLVFDFFCLYNNVNIFVERSHEYAAEGRIQDEAQADALADAMKLFLQENGIPYYSITANDANPVYLCHWMATQGLIALSSTARPFGPEDVPPPGWIKPYFNGSGRPVGSSLDKHYIPSGVRTKGDVPPGTA